MATDDLHHSEPVPQADSSPAKKDIGTDDPRHSKPVHREDFGPAKKYARHGSSHHQHGWQEKQVRSEHRAPLAPEGSIPRTPLAERLRQQVTEHEKE